jgi:hypothetical protein
VALDPVRADDAVCTPFLMVRATNDDEGTRPLAATTPFWESPDVWITGGLGINQPIPGETCTVHGRVTNSGLLDAYGVLVTFYWASPSTAVTESSAHLIGYTTVDIPAGTAVEVACPTPWVPAAENLGHECLLVEASLTGDPLIEPRQPGLDRHVGQRNEQLMRAAPGAAISVSVAATNVSDVTAPMVFTIEPFAQTSGPGVVPSHTQLTLAGEPMAGKPLQVDVKVAAKSSPLGLRTITDALAWVAGPVLGRRPAVQVTQMAEFRAGETRMVEVTGQVPQDAQAGQILGFRLSHRIGDQVVGGYTVHVLVTEGCSTGQLPTGTAGPSARA